jgi:hypothetical protein
MLIMIIPMFERQRKLPVPKKARNVHWDLDDGELDPDLCFSVDNRGDIYDEVGNLCMKRYQLTTTRYHQLSLQLQKEC